MNHKIAVIVGSTRPIRIGREIADWFTKQASNTPGADFTIIDLKDVNLPFLDEPHAPATGIQENPHTKKWKQQIEQYDAYIFVTPEYNAGYPAPLKNAIDYLKQEWANKPATIVSYGWGGGASASAQLKQVLERLQMRPTATSPAFSFSSDTFDEKAELVDVHNSFVKHSDEIDTAVAELIQLVQAS